MISIENKKKLEKNQMEILYLNSCISMEENNGYINSRTLKNYNKYLNLIKQENKDSENLTDLIFYAKPKRSDKTAKEHRQEG